MANYVISSYQCRQYTYNKAGYVALIHLYDADNYIRGVIYFYPDGTHIPEAREDTSVGRIYLSLPVSRLGSFVDVLRNEEPVDLCYNSSTDAFLETSLEPTGEEETL